MTEFKFTPGEYLTRDGRRAVVLCDDAPGIQPLVGYTVVNGVACPTSWTCAGTYDDRPGHPDIYDLMPPTPLAPERVVRWVSLYSDGSAFTWELLWNAKHNRGTPLAITRVVLTPGQFDDEDTPSEWDRAIDAADEALGEFLKRPSIGASFRDSLLALKRGNGK